MVNRDPLYGNFPADKDCPGGLLYGVLFSGSSCALLCPAGYENIYASNITCSSGNFNGYYDGLVCRDVDECLFSSTFDCPDNAACVNLPGSYTCADFAFLNTSYQRRRSLLNDQSSSSTLMLSTLGGDTLSFEMSISAAVNLSTLNGNSFIIFLINVYLQGPDASHGRAFDPNDPSSQLRIFQRGSIYRWGLGSLVYEANASCPAQFCGDLAFPCNFTNASMPFDSPVVDNNGRIHASASCRTTRGFGSKFSLALFRQTTSTSYDFLAQSSFSVGYGEPSFAPNTIRLATSTSSPCSNIGQGICQFQNPDLSQVPFAISGSNFISSPFFKLDPLLMSAQLVLNSVIIPCQIQDGSSELQLVLLEEYGTGQLYSVDVSVSRGNFSVLPYLTAVNLEANNLKYLVPSAWLNLSTVGFGEWNIASGDQSTGAGQFFSYALGPTIISALGCVSNSLSSFANSDPLISKYVSYSFVTSGCPTGANDTFNQLLFLYITGTNFYESNSTRSSFLSSFTVGGKACNNPTRVQSLPSGLSAFQPAPGAVTIKCLLPSGAGKNKAIVAKWPQSGLSSTQTDGFVSYAAPNITRMESPGCASRSSEIWLTQCARSGNYSLTITGTNFAPGRPNIIIGGLTCSYSDDPTYAYTDSLEIIFTLSCVMAAGSGTQNVILVQADGQISGTGAFVTYNDCPQFSQSYSNGQCVCNNHYYWFPAANLNDDDLSFTEAQTEDRDFSASTVYFIMCNVKLNAYKQPLQCK